jgi:CheY-like chemotaxis protein
MAERLGERGFEVVEADSGEKALELLDQFAFDVIITDLRLPGIDGAGSSSRRSSGIPASWRS